MLNTYLIGYLVGRNGRREGQTMYINAVTPLSAINILLHRIASNSHLLEILSITVVHF